MHSNLDDQSLAEWMDDWMRRFGFRCTLHGPGIRYSFVHDALTNDYQSLRNLLLSASPKDDNNNNDTSKASVGYALPMSSKPSTTGSLPELPSIASSKNDDSRTLNLQMKPTSLGCRDDLLASNNRAIFILVEARPSKLCELGMVLKGGGCGFRPKFVKLRRQFVVPSNEPDLYHENVTVVSKNAVKLKEGDILHRVDECEMHPIMQHESKMKALKLVVGKAGEEGRSISLLFVRYLDTASGNTMIDDNNDDIIDFNVGIEDDWDKEDTVEGEDDEVLPGEGNQTEPEDMRRERPRFGPRSMTREMEIVTMMGRRRGVRKRQASMPHIMASMIRQSHTWMIRVQWDCMLFCFQMKMGDHA